MELTVAALVIASALLHPVREVLIKGNAYPEGVAYAVMVMFGVFSGLEVLALGVDPWAALEVWRAVLISSTGLVLFYLCTVLTMKMGEVSVYYPITRSSPLFVVTVGFLVLGQRYSPMLLAGVVVVVTGAFLLQYEPGTRVLHRPRALALAVCAMCAHGLLTLADAEAMRTVGPAQFFFLQYLLVVPTMAVVFAATRLRGRSVSEHLLGGWRHTPLRFLSAGLTAYASYYLILLAFQMGGNVAAVASLRQISIPMSVLIGGYYLRESRTIGRLGWSMFLSVGVVLIIVSK